MAQKCTIILATLVVLSVAVSQTSGQLIQSSCLYAGRSGVGEYFCNSQTYIPHLQNVQFDNKAYSFCATGIFLFYDYPNFNKGQNAQMEFVFGPNNFCGDFRNIAGRVTSVRFAGDPKNYMAQSITLYEGPYFQGEEEFLLGNAPNLNLGYVAASLILTGAQPWTLYDQPNYGGNRICVYPPTSDNGTPALIAETESISVPRGSIRSIAKGCYGKKSVVAENVIRGNLNATSAGQPIPFAPDFDPAPIDINTAPFSKLE